MPKPYSGDLRARVIEEIVTGASRREAAECLENIDRRFHDLRADTVTWNKCRGKLSQRLVGCHFKLPL
jgi:hypothetical protein